MYSSEDIERLFIRYKGEAIRVARAYRHSVAVTISLTICLKNGTRICGIAEWKWRSMLVGYSP